MPTTRSTATISSVPFSNVPVRELGDTKIAYEVLRFVPEESARHYRIVPLAIRDGVLEVGMIDPEDIEAVDALNFITRTSGMPFKIFQIAKDDLEKVLQMYRGLGGEVERAVTELESETSRD